MFRKHDRLLRAAAAIALRCMPAGLRGQVRTDDWHRIHRARERRERRRQRNLRLAARGAYGRGAHA